MWFIGYVTKCEANFESSYLINRAHAEYVNIRGYAAVVDNPYRNPNMAEHDKTEKPGLVPTQNAKYFRTKNENRKSGNVNRFALLKVSKLNLNTKY